MTPDWLRQKFARRSAAQPPAAVGTPLTADELAAEMRLVEAALVKGNVNDAFPRVEALMKTNPNEPEVVAHVGICLHLRGDIAESVAPLVRAVNLDPKNARALYFLGASLAAENEVIQAGAVLRRALELTPQDKNLLLLAGTVFGRMGSPDEAALYLNRAQELEPEGIAPLMALEILGQQTLRRSSNYDSNTKVADARKRVANRLLAAYRKGNIDNDGRACLLALLSGMPDRFMVALEIARASVSIEPMPTPLAQQMFLVFWTAGDTALALKFSELCYDRDPARPSYREALCSSWLATGSEHWSSAWRIMTESYQSSRPDQYLQTGRVWAGQKLGKKRLLVYQDQGHGDAILCLRFLPMLAARGVPFDLWVLPPMVELASFAPGYGKLLRLNYRPDPAALGYDFAAPMYGLIPALYLQPHELRNPPVIRPRPEYAPELRSIVSPLPGVRIGLVYGGNPLRRDDWLRSLPLQCLRALASIPGISWVNLAIDYRPDKAEAMEMFRMVDPMPQVRNFADTAAIVDELDAVVSIDCSVAHIAGNLGKPFWVLVPPSAEWRWQIGDDTRAWWPTANLLRSEAPGDWTLVLQRLEDGLKQFVDSFRRG